MNRDPKERLAAERRRATLSNGLDNNKRIRRIPALCEALADIVGIDDTPSRLLNGEQTSQVNACLQASIPRLWNSESTEKLESMRRDRIADEIEGLLMGCLHHKIVVSLSHWSTTAAFWLRANEFARCALKLLDFDGDTVLAYTPIKGAELLALDQYPNRADDMRYVLVWRSTEIVPPSFGGHNGDTEQV